MNGGEVQQWDEVFLRSLGYFLVQANYFEEALLDTYWAATGYDREAAVQAVRRLTLGPMKDLVVETVERGFQGHEIQLRMTRLRPDLDNAVNLRNQFIHASWTFDHAREEMIRERRIRRGQVAQELRRLKVSDVEQATQVVGDLAQSLWEEIFDLIGEVRQYR